MLQSLRTVDGSRSVRKKIKKDATGKVARMSDVFDIFDGNVRIYRTTMSGDVWQMRMYVKDEQRYRTPNTPWTSRSQPPLWSTI